VSRACREFRDRLATALRTGPASEPADVLRTLSWHEHLVGCGDCRALLAAEEALEDLLATLPRPRLPAGVAERVLARLALERESAALDRLLEVARSAPAPAGLPRKVLTRLEGARADAALDRLLGMVPAPVAPRGLAARVLWGLEPERAPRPALPLRRRAPSPLTLGLRLAAAVALAVGGLLGLRALRREAPAPQREVVLNGRPEQPPAELLESLDLLEAWDLITDESLDVVLTSLDTADEVLLEIDRGSDPLAVPPEEPSKG